MNNRLSISVWIRAITFFIGLLSMIPPRAALAAGSDVPLDLGSRRELFVDRALIGTLQGGARQVLHHPTPQNVVLVHDAPWEGSGSGYHSVFQDGDRFRMYYKGWRLTVGDGKLTLPHELVACYAESDDGIHWRKPDLGLVEFQGSRHNNIVLATGLLSKADIDPGHVAVFRDDNPACPPEARYKAFVRGRKTNGLVPLASADGLHWSALSDGPVITKGAFDSQNLAFWDPNLGAYRAYFRVFDQGRRDILTATSADFVHWTDPEPLIYPDAPAEQLYTNQIKPYPRAPHLLIGFPTRYTERTPSASLQALPDPEHRAERMRVSQRYGTAITEGLLMVSRDGRSFHRWKEAFLRPGPERPGTWNYGQQYIAWHVVETASPLEGAPNELSLFATERYWTGQGSALRRYTLRLDGFVSVQAPLDGGELRTPLVRFQGRRLHLNVATSAAGGVRVEIQDAQGQPIPGFALDDGPELFGDSVDRIVNWNCGSDVSALAGRPVRLRFVLRDADLYAFQFAD